MKVIKCLKGHYYDADKYSECPHCKNGIKKIKKENFEYKQNIKYDNKPQESVITEEDVTAPLWEADEEKTVVLTDFMPGKSKNRK